METILVTGAAGFIGSNLVGALLKEGYTVVGIDNFDTTYNPLFKHEHLAPYLTNPNFEMVEADICNKEDLQKLFKKIQPTHVAHLAAKADTRAAVENPYPYIENNIQGLTNIFEVAKQTDVSSVVFSSSSSVYGNDTKVPWKESACADTPLSPYGASKRAGELFAHAYYHNFGMHITCLRYFNAYGECNRPNMVLYKWAEALLRGEPIELSGAGTRKRDYTYVGDTVTATIAALKKPMGYEIINIGNNHPLSLAELLSVFEKVIGVKAVVKERPSHPASVEETYADITKAKNLLDWEPKVSIEEGVTRLVSWFRANRL